MVIVAAAGLGGSLSAHLAGALAHAGGEAGEVAHGSLDWAPTILATSAVIVGAVLLRGRVARRVLAASLVASPVIAFVLQEWLERLLSAESSPFGAGREPGLLGTAAALLPWILAALLVLRAVAAAVRAVASRSALGFVLVPPAVGPESVPRVSPAHAGRYDSILDRPPRAPPGP